MPVCAAALARLPGIILLPLALGLAPIARAQATDNAQLQQRLEQSMRLIDALSQRVDQLERQLAAQAPRSAPAASAADAKTAQPAEATTAARLDEVERTLGQISASSGRELRDTGLPLHGFVDVGVMHTRNAPAGHRDGFALGSLDLYLTPELGPNVKSLVELNFGVTSDGESILDIERAQIGYAFSDALTLWLGRFHTPMGFWNMAFHHGAQIQPSILRPRMLDFEDDGGILPVHTTGAWATGNLRLGSDRLTYNLYVGNGTRIADGELDPNPAGDDNGSKVLGFGLVYRLGGAWDGLSLGLNGLRQTVHAYDAGDVLINRTRLAMLGAHAVYDNLGWELIAELYRLNNSDLDKPGASYRSSTGYLHIGHSFDERWMPYFRYEKASLNQADKYFSLQANGRSYRRQVLGLRYNADPRAAVKLEFNRTDDEGIGHAVDELRLQYSISF